MEWMDMEVDLGLPSTSGKFRRKRDAGVVGLKVRRDPRHGSRRKTEEDDS